MTKALEFQGFVAPGTIEASTPQPTGILMNQPVSRVTPGDIEETQSSMLELPDAELGRLVKHWAEKVKEFSIVLKRPPHLSAALMLIEMMTSNNAAQMDVTLEGCDVNDNPAGDWRIRIEQVGAA